jgi:hypothetical protein
MTRRTLSPLPVALAVSAALAGFAWTIAVSSGANLLHYDAKAHLVVARRVLDSATPGWLQLGVVWLPLPHVLNALPSQSDWLYSTGVFASALSVAAFVAGLAALAVAAARATGDEWAGVVALAVPALNPGWLYAQATPLTEPLAAGLLGGLVLALVRWRQAGRDRDLWRAAAFSAAACLVRYEAWAVAAAAVVVVGTAPRLSRPAAFRFALAGLLAPVLLYGLHSWLAAGRPFVVMTPEFLTGPRGDLARAVRLLATGAADTYGPPLALAGAVALAVALARRHALGGPLLACLAAGAVAVAAYLAGHPAKARYALLLAPAIALALAAATAGSRAGQAAALALALTQGVFVSDPSPMLAESTRRLSAAVERRPVVAAFRREYAGGRLLASMGSSAPFLFELQLPLREVVHEGNHPHWERALESPRREVSFVLVAEGDLIDRERARRPGLLEGFEPWLRFRRSVLFRRAAQTTAPNAANTLPKAQPRSAAPRATPANSRPDRRSGWRVSTPLKMPTPRRAPTDRAHDTGSAQPATPRR